MAHIESIRVRLIPKRISSFIGEGEIIGWGCGAKPLRYDIVYLGYKGIFVIL